MKGQLLLVCMCSRTLNDMPTTKAPHADRRRIARHPRDPRTRTAPARGVWGESPLKRAPPASDTPPRTARTRVARAFARLDRRVRPDATLATRRVCFSERVRALHLQSQASHTTGANPQRGKLFGRVYRFPQSIITTLRAQSSDSATTARQRAARLGVSLRLLRLSLAIIPYV